VQGEAMEEKLLIISSDSHAGVPQELWEHYLPERFHELLPSLHDDCVLYPTAMALMARKKGATSLPEINEAHTVDYHGLHDATLRMADMDREGITAELIYLGDSRLGDMFHNVSGRGYPLEAWEAGAKAWNRWAADNFGFAMERFLVTGAIGPCVDMDATVAEVHWMADHDFIGIYGPRYMWHRDMPELTDAYWDPFWAACSERNITVVVHAGFGTPHGHVFPEIEKIYADVAAAAGSTDRDALLEHADAISDESVQFFADFLSRSIEARRPMWQLMLSGVFDRHPQLKLLLTEIRLDWIPATLAHLDAIYEAHRDQFSAARKPSEYWPTNCLAGASFIHKAEVEMRHEIGVETILFGRDFPHPEGTWPNTADWLRHAFAGVPEDEARLMLGENAIRFFGLDRPRLVDIAKRVGPRLEDVIAGGTDVRPELLENFAFRGGYLKPSEGGSMLPVVDDALRKDLDPVGITI
jgi:predicted TIM-barrel fold metal-dependent hydrolase